MKWHLGPPIAQSNRNIRKLLRLARASKNDVFYDLGCGHAQLCIIAATEFRVKRAVGIERLRARAKRAKQRVKALGLSHRVEIVNLDYWDSDLSEATIAYNGLSEEPEDLEFYEGNLRKGCRLVTLSLPLMGILPKMQDYPFYLMRRPFKRATSVSEWISAVLSIRAPVDQFLAEMGNDPDYWTDRRRLKGLARQRFGLEALREGK